MAKTTSLAQFQRDLLKEFRELTDLRKLKNRDLKAIAEEIIHLMLENIKKGISPITGKRFPAYKNPKRYPGKRKPKRPVNLELTGEFLSALEFTVRSGKNPTITIGFFDKENADKEKGHREGAGGQPKRPIIPNSSESFSKKITIEITNEIADVLSRAIAK